MRARCSHTCDLRPRGRPRSTRASTTERSSAHARHRQSALPRGPRSDRVTDVSPHSGAGRSSGSRALRVRGHDSYWPSLPNPASSRKRSGDQCAVTAFVLADRCGAALDSHQVPCSPERTPGHQHEGDHRRRDATSSSNMWWCSARESHYG
ncbi:hypothetical protein DB32_008422 [Sandaracinus amylolyticus]|uniref:Uncharacterized protein n=1 Tax=Sandaracinus amylolyticus TaxID=927083 RepID=A0A0F6WA36_9BACT|nr:hypothetical protein DB32_008422 [Sandaracinus amylolyticus]